MGAWTTGERWTCSERCAEVGDPPCWDLGEHCDPCEDCAGAPIPEDAEQRRVVNELGRMLAELRAKEEAAVAVTYAAHAGTTDCPNGYVSVRIEMEKESATSEAVNLIDALWMARAKVRALVAKRKAEEAEAKASAEPRP